MLIFERIPAVAGATFGEEVENVESVEELEAFAADSTACAEQPGLIIGRMGNGDVLVDAVAKLGG